MFTVLPVRGKGLAVVTIRAERAKSANKHGCQARDGDEELTSTTR